MLIERSSLIVENDNSRLNLLTRKISDTASVEDFSFVANHMA